MRIDLHTHSSASDGTDSPTELIAHAVSAGLDVVALTDHDTTSGWTDAETAVRSADDAITLVPGAEFSCFTVNDDGRRISMHVLGYLFDPEHVELRAERARLREARDVRARRIVDRMAADGLPISWPLDVAPTSGAIGRPHIARALVQAGVVPDVGTAFRELLSSRQNYYEPKADTPVLDAVSMIRAAGGLPVFAHPLARRRGPVVDKAVAAAMTDAGLVGIEVDHPDHDESDRAEAAAWARELRLIPTGSSDYHGANKLTRLGANTTSDESYQALLDLPAARKPITQRPSSR